MTIEETIKSTKPLDLESRTLINIMYTSRFIESQAEHFKDFDITEQQFNVLRILRGQKGNPANLFTIQERMIDKNSNTTRLVDKLIQKKFVKRQVCPQNRRKVEIFITPEGLDFLEEINPSIVEFNTNMLQNLSAAEKESLNQLLDKIRE